MQTLKILKSWSTRDLDLDQFNNQLFVVYFFLRWTNPKMRSYPAVDFLMLIIQNCDRL